MRSCSHATDSASHLIRLLEAERTKCAGEIARRSEPRDETSLARKMGAGSAANLVAQVTGVPRAQAGTMVASGEAFRPRESITGEPLPAVCPQVAAAFADGLLDPEIAAAMRRALAKAAPGLAPFEVDDLEATVLARSQEGWDPDTLLGVSEEGPRARAPRRWRTRSAEPRPRCRR